MKFGSRHQILASALKIATLSAEERTALKALAANDDLKPTDYVLERHGGILYADNGYSLVYDLTNGRSTSADSIPEAAEHAKAIA